MYVWKDTAVALPSHGKKFTLLSDNYLVSLKNGNTCRAFYDPLARKWFSAETLLPFPKGEVVAWRDKINEKDR